jgi:hypothetical protein
METYVMTNTQASAAVTPSTELICEQCGGLAAAVPCPAHPDEPLLDLATPGMRAYLADLDDQARRRLYGRWSTGGVVLLGALASIVPIAVTGVLELDVIGVLVAAAMGAVGGRAIASRLFSARFTQWTD